MPSLKNSMIDLDVNRYRRIEPRPHDPIAHPVPFQPMPPPALPVWIKRSPVMVSSLPSISTSVDGIIRQFYGGPNFPTRRVSGI